MEAVEKNDTSRFINILNRIWNGPNIEQEPVRSTNVSAFKIEVKTEEPEQPEAVTPEFTEQSKPDIYPIRPDFQPQKPHEFSSEQDHGLAKQITLISKGTTIVGDLKSDGDLEIYGTVKGGVSTTGNIKIGGKQSGDVAGANITLVSCTVRGNITATEDVNIDSDSVIIGDIKTKNLIINGKLQGNIQAKNSISCQGNAIVIGDLMGATVTVSDGAKLQGKMQIFNGQMGDIKIQDDLRNLSTSD